MSFLDALLGRLNISDDGDALPTQPTLNFVGATVADDPTNKTTDVSFPASFAAAAVASVSALKALATGGSVVVDGQQRQVLGDPVPWIYDANSGSGFAGDDTTYARPNDVLTGSNGRWYRATSAPVLPTIAALRLAISGRHQSIVVKSYAAVGDGGEGHFDYDSTDTTTADDGGVVIVAGTRRYKRRISGHLIDVRWFGAKGNDITHDDLPGIQAASDYCFAHTFTTVVSGPSPDIRYTNPRVFCPGGRTWSIGRRATETHGLELPGQVHLIGDKGTMFIPRTVSVTASTSDTFTSVAPHGFAIGEAIMIQASYLGALPGGVKESTLYYVIADGFTTSTFKVSATVGGSAVDVTSAGSLVSAYVAHAMIVWQIARGVIEGIQFVGGYDAIALVGNTVNYGYMGAFFSAEYGGNVVDCQFINQAGPSVWQDASPISHPANTRTTGPIKFTRCTFRTPVAFWGMSDKLDFSHCTFVWDQSQIIADLDAGLPASMHTADGRPLGCVNQSDNVFFDHCFIDPLGAIAGKKWPERNAFGVGHGNWTFTNTIWGELGGCLVRARGIGNGYQGIGEAVVAFNDMSVIVGAPLRLTTIGNCLFDVFTKNIVELYDLPLRALRLGKGDEINMGGTLGVWVDSATVTQAQMIQLQAAQQILESDYITGPVVRWRTSTEANGFTAIGGQPRGEPIADGTGITDITGIFEAYWHNRPDAEFHHDARPQANLFNVDLYKVVNGGGSTQVELLFSHFASESTESSTGYTLPTFTTSTVGGQLGFTTPPWGSTLAAGVYTFSCDVVSTADVLWTFQYTFDSNQCPVAPRKVVGGAGRGKRYEFSFYFPGGGAEFTFQGYAQPLPAATTMSFDLFKIELGRKATPYTAPVDVPASPTTNTVSPKIVGRYLTDTVPATGVYKLGDRIIHPNPTPGTWAEQTCTVASTTHTGNPTFRITETAANDPSILDVATRYNALVVIDGSHGSINTGEEDRFTKALTGVRPGDRTLIEPLRYTPDGWELFGAVSANDTVQVSMLNVTGTNGAFPLTMGVSVTVEQHPPFESFFPSIKSWLEADLGVSPGGGPVNTWADQSNNSNGAGPQGTAAKRPALVAATLNGHAVLRSNNANVVNLPIAWTLGAGSSIYAVVGGLTSNLDVLFLCSNLGEYRIEYNRAASKNYEFHNQGTFRTIGTTVNHADYHVLGIVNSDAGNTTLYFDGVQTYDAAIDAALAGFVMTQIFSFRGVSNSPDGDAAEVLWYNAAHTDDQAIETSLRLQTKYGL